MITRADKSHFRAGRYEKISKDNLRRIREMNGETKLSLVLEHLESGKAITPREAVALFDAWRLADIIFTLKGKGHEIRNLHEGTGKHGLYVYVFRCCSCNEEMGGPGKWCSNSCMILENGVCEPDHGLHEAGI